MLAWPSSAPPSSVALRPRQAVSSDGGVLLLGGADKRLGLIDTLAALIPDHRDPALITHTMEDILRARVFAIACGYPDADDLDVLRYDAAFKLACGRLPETGDNLAPQPTMSRWENAPDLRTLIRLSRAMVDLWCQSYPRPPKVITLDIDDTADTVHGHQQLALFNAFHMHTCSTIWQRSDEAGNPRRQRCFFPAMGRSLRSCNTSSRAPVAAGRRCARRAWHPPLSRWRGSDFASGLAKDGSCV